MVDTPTSLSYLSYLNCACNSVYYQEDGRLLVGSDGHLQVYDSNDHIVSKTHSNIGNIFAAVQHNSFIYILHKKSENNGCKVDMLSPDASTYFSLFEFTNNNQYFWPTLAVSDKYVAAVCPQAFPNEPDKLYLYDICTTQLIISDVVGSGISFMANGDLLLADWTSVTRFRINNGDLSVVWVCDDVTDVNGICVADDGLIYASTDDACVLYVISPDGMYSSIQR